MAVKIEQYVPLFSCQPYKIAIQLPTVDTSKLDCFYLNFFLFRAIGFYNKADTLESSSILIYFKKE